MDSERWQRVNQVFLEAIEREAEARTEFLAESCGDDTELIAEVESLIESHESADDSFLVSSSLNVKSQMPGLAATVDEFIGQTIGAYEVRRRIGSGGMGNVYLAVRTSDYNQRVAIKVIKRGMDSEEILRRFRTEVRVLAAVSKHEHIAALIDAGTTDDGRPYFVMEYVEGEQIDRYCDANRLTIRERLRLFQAVCDAVAFAHQHTVVHRDLKPSNILVSSDGKPKLIDFGIAKLTTPELGAETALPTATEFRVMTPEYASPEQVRGDSVSTVSDVYSLGILLYEMLSGRRPYRIAGRSQREMERIICQEDPPKPSTAVTRKSKDGETEGPSTAQIGEQRHRSGRSLKRMLSGDLDNIVLKAIRKEPQRRYSSVEQLSRDIDRFIADKPVTARPIGTIERMWRFCRRNPVPVGLLAAVLLSAALGIWHLSRLSRQLVESTALEGAAQQAEFMEEVQDFYSDRIIKRAKRSNVETSHRYLENDRQLPVPATFTIDLGKHIESVNESGSYARLYSDMPFKHRKGGGTNDAFERDAIAALRRNPDEPFFRFENYKGRPSLRYAKARVMAKSCVDCHNSHEDSPKDDWKVGEVRGVLEIIRPLDQDIERVHDGLQGTFIAMGALSGSLLLVALLMLLVKRQREAS